MNRIQLGLRWLVLFVLACAQVLAPAPANALSDIIPGATSFDRQGNSYSLPARGLRASLGSRGLLLSAADGQNWTWDLQLDGFGRGANPMAPGSAVTNASGAQVTSRYAGFSQWLRASGIGIEQGFSVEQKPAGSGDLVLRMRLSTSLAGSLSKDARSLSFATSDGKTLHYSNLRAFDAAGRELAAKLVYIPGQITIQLDDSHALYPLSLDPLIYFESQLFAMDGAVTDQFGGSVAISGDTAVVGAKYKNSDRGAAYVFQRTGTTWIQQAELSTSDPANTQLFGSSVAISGNTIVVGSEEHYPTSTAYVYVQPAGGWSNMTETAQLTSSDGTGNDNYGHAVAISGSTIVIGAYYHNNGAGKAYVFAQPAGGWANMAETAQLTATDPGVNFFFGQSVAVSGNTIVVGGPEVNSGTGKAYVFVKPAGAWVNATEAAQLTASDAAANSQFGFAVAISGNTLVVGAPELNSSTGKAYVFVQPGGGWSTSTETAALTASDAGANNSLGQSVSISGDLVLVGAAWAAGSYRGKAYVYVKPAGNWTNATESAGLVASDGIPSDFFGGSVAVDGDTAVVGAHGKGNYLGGAYVEYPYSAADLSVQALGSPANPLPGQSMTLTASVTNLNTTTAVPQAAVSAPVPAGFQYLGSTTPFGVYDPASGIWNMGALGPGATASLAIQVSPLPTLAGKTVTFSDSLLGLDANPANNTAFAAIKVSPLSLSLLTLSFAGQLLNTTSPAQTVTATNLGSAALTLGTLKVGAGFLLVKNTCNFKTLAHNAACTFGVAFKPTGVMGFHDTLTVPHNGLGGSSLLKLSGVGVAGTELLGNNSFESASIKVPTGWTKAGTWVPADGQACSTFHTGSCSLKFTGTGLLKSLSYTVMHSGVSGDDYMFSLWNKAAGVPAAPIDRVRVLVYKGAVLIMTKILNFAPGTHAFTRSSTTFTMTAPYTRLVFIIEYNAHSGTAWFDDASLTWAP